MINRCCLCGGRIRDGRCVECGMPLQEPTSRVILEDEQVKDVRTARRTERKDSTAAQDKGNNKKEKKNYKKKSTASSYDYRTASPAGKPLKPQNNKAAGVFGKTVAFISVLIAVLGCVIPLVTEIFDDPESAYEYEDDSYEYDPYEFIEEELPAGDEEWEGILEPGFYEVGVHIPVGEYTVTAREGSGTIRLTNHDIGLNVSEYMSADSENEEDTSEMSGLLCYEGSILEVDSPLSITLTTETAVADTMTYVPNELTEAYEFEGSDDGTVIVAGEDFPAGFYDLTSSGEYGAVSYQIMDSTDFEWSYYFYLPEGKGGSRNLLLPEDTEVTVWGQITLTPSEKLGEEWDEYFYDRVN